jgi:hypothetical protein
VRSERISSRPGRGKTTTTYRAAREFFYASLVAPKEASMAPFRLEVEALEIAKVIVGKCCDHAAYAVDIVPRSVTGSMTVPAAMSFARLHSLPVSGRRGDDLPGIAAKKSQLLLELLQIAIEHRAPAALRRNALRGPEEDRQQPLCLRQSVVFSLDRYRQPETSSHLSPWRSIHDGQRRGGIA